MSLIRRFITPNIPSTTTDEPGNGRWLIAMFVLILLISLGLRLWQGLHPEPPFLLLPDAVGLVEMSSVADASARSTIQAVAVPEILDAEIVAVGVYTISSDIFPAGSIVVELAREDARFVEIIEKPKTTLEEELVRFASAAQTDVNLNGTNGKLLDLHNELFTCLSRNETRTISVCEITKVLLFEKDGLVISIGADGNRATEGELIQFGKAMTSEEPEQ